MGEREKEKKGAPASPSGNPGTSPVRAPWRGPNNSRQTLTPTHQAGTYIQTSGWMKGEGNLKEDRRAQSRRAAHRHEHTHAQDREGGAGGVKVEHGRPAQNIYREGGRKKWGPCRRDAGDAICTAQRREPKSERSARRRLKKKRRSVQVQVLRPSTSEKAVALWVGQLVKGTGARGGVQRRQPLTCRGCGRVRHPAEGDADGPGAPRGRRAADTK